MFIWLYLCFKYGGYMENTVKNSTFDNRAKK